MLQKFFLSAAVFSSIFSLSGQTPRPPREPRSEVLSPPYTQPGIIANQGGRWVGSDHLFNLTHQIGIEVEIIGPKGVALPFSTESIKMRVNERFRQEGLSPIPRGRTDISKAEMEITDVARLISDIAVLNPNELFAQGGVPTGAGPSNIQRPPLKPPQKPKAEPRKDEKPHMIEVPRLYTPLPFFHVLIMINPIEKGYVAYVGTRLFESIDIKRSGAQLDQQTAFQAITWERQLLLITAKEDLLAQVNSSVDELTTEFLNRYKYFQQLRFQGP